MSTEIRRTRLAVFGSIDAERARSEHSAAPSPAVGAVLEQVYDRIAASALPISQPIVERAVGEGRISRAERHELLCELGRARGAGAPPAGAAELSFPARRVLGAAVRRAAPGIAGPILDEAVADERLTRAQRQRVLERLRTSPATALRRRPDRRRRILGT